jgi:uncharacterized protein YraI
MKQRNITLIIISILIGLLGGFGFYETNKDKTDEEIVNNAIEEVKDYIDNASTTEIPNLNETDEQSVEVQETESEGFEEQGQVAYEGSEKTPNVNVGDYAGLTYYSQIDSRWSNKMYSSVGDRLQTIGTSGCGPTSSAMVVSSIKGTITPDVMAGLYTQYGYRSANQGTYWSAFRWTADVFNIGYSECYRLDDAVAKLRNNHYIIASCNQGLFTYGGHFIVLTGVEGNYIKVYDPYLYNGKFDVSSRRGKAEVRGNTVYVSIDNFRAYANYQKFFCFKNDRTDVKENTTNVVISNTTSSVSNVNYKVRITSQSGLNMRSGVSASYSRIGGYSKNSTATILAESNGWGKTDRGGWICLAYTSRYTTVAKSTAQKSEKYKVNASILNVRTGPGTKYKIKGYKQLTANARYQNKKLGNQYVNGLKKGVVTTVTKIQNGFGLTPSGYICLDYCTNL